MDADHGHGKVTGRPIIGLFLMVVSTLTTWSSKFQIAVKTSIFGADSTALNKASKESVMIWYHLRSMGIKVSKPTAVFVDNMSVVLNATNPGSTLNKKSVALSYHFFR